MSGKTTHNSACRRLCAIATAVFLTAAFVPAPRARDVELPYDKQYPLFLKVLLFDQEFDRKVGNEVRIGILYQKNNPASVAARDSIFEAARRSEETIRNKKTGIISIDLDNEDLATAITTYGINALYVTPLSSGDFERITETTRFFHVTTCTGVRDYVSKGISVGLGAKSQRPEIILNLSAAEAEGISFSSKLLRIATLIR